jgi:hypothetical protein
MMASAIIAQIQSAIQTRLQTASDIVIDEGLLGIAGAGELLQATTGAGALAVSQATLTTADDVLTLRGTAAILDATAIPVEFQFSDNGGLVVNMQGRVPALTPLVTAAAGRFLKGKFTVPNGLINLRIKTVSVTVVTATRTALVVFADTGDNTVADLFTLRQPRLSLAATGLNQDSPTVVAHLDGLLVIANVLFTISGMIGDNGDFSVTPALQGLPLTVEQFVSALLNTTGVRLPTLPVSGLNLTADLDAGNVTIVATVTGSWKIPLGVNPPDLTGASITISKRGNSVTGRIDASMSLAGQSLVVQAGLPGELILSGQLPALNITDLAHGLIGPGLTIPAGVPQLRLDASQFTIRFDGDNPTFTVVTTVNSFGMVGVVVANVSGQWQVLAVFATPTDFHLSQLAPVLAPLDVLNIGAPRLTIASFDAEDFAVPAVGGVMFPSEVHKGIVLDATLSLHGHGLDFVTTLLEQNQLPLQLAAPADLATAKIAATLAGTKVLIPGVVTLEKIELAFVPTPFTVNLQSDAQVVIRGEVLPEFRITVGLADGTEKISLESVQPWVKPFGIPGLTIQKVIFDVQTAPALAYGVLGDVAIAGRTLRIACQFVTGEPDALVGELQGRLDLGDVLKDLVGFTLPPALDLSIEDFSMQIVANPLGATIGSVHFDPGLSLCGTLGILGLELLANVRINPDSGVFASGALKNKVTFGNVLSITNAAGDGPPSLLLDTTGSPMLRLNGNVTLLGLSDSIDASVDKSGFSVRLQQSDALGKYDLNTQFTSVQQFRTVGSFSFGLSATIHTDLGDLVLDTGCTGSITVSMSNGSFSLVANGQFIFAGNTLTIPTFQTTTAIDSLHSLPQQIRDLVVQKVQDVFQSILGDPDKWLAAIAANAIRDVENIAGILKNRFGKDATYIGTRLKSVLHDSSLEVGQALKGIGTAPEDIAAELRNLGDQAPNVRDTLTRLGVPADQISRILSTTFAIPHLDQIVHTDFHGDTPLIPPVNIHGDTPLIPPVNIHGDTPLIPPVNIHGDTPLIPHLDQHVDTPLVPRVNQHTDHRGPGIANHLDKRIAGHHIDQHTDVPGPHIDTHIDTPGRARIDTHTDSPGRAHIDTHTDSRGRAHVDVHTDTLGRSHIDTHTDTPGQARVDTHVNTSVHTDSP